MSQSSENKTSRSRLLRNWISLVGLVLATASFFAFVLLFAVDLLSHHGNPYMGILAYVVAPSFLAAGLVLTFTGAWLKLRQEHRAQPGALAGMLTIDLLRARDRRILIVFLMASVGFLFLTALGSYQTYHYTETVQFCGQACHVPMDPEFVTSQHSPHARVECVACHVGPGAVAYFRTKINGVRQLYHTLVGDFDRPIRLTAAKQRPAQETCEQCHWPQKYTGPMDHTLRHFLADEKNTPFSVRLLLNVGGGDPASGPVGGIHWHMNLGNKIEYISPDETRAKIPWIRFTNEKGVATEYRAPDFKDDPAKYAIHTMDCMDCHNRPSHRFRTPNDAVDLALANGQIDSKIPWVKAKVVEALARPYSTKPEALQKIDASLRAAYPDRADLGPLISQAQAIYNDNFFPEMKADWRVHPDNLSHKETNGCFRCHDGQHKAADGKTTVKASDCKACHLILAQGNDEEILKLNAKGLEFVHIDSEYSDFSCSECHTGASPK
ncbi:MAG: NapC/NirT family cytochrome c [Verrucomicrobia bacterium]|nr:NapC/NirT family cytochrome c [Verrucomicrobiota bacterium]